MLMCVCARLFPQTVRLPSLDDQVDISIVDAGKAFCRTEYDREALLGVVEASYGTCAEFNKVLHDVLNAPRTARRSPLADLP